MKVYNNALALLFLFVFPENISFYGNKEQLLLLSLDSACGPERISYKNNGVCLSGLKFLSLQDNKIISIKNYRAVVN